MEILAIFIIVFAIVMVVLDSMKTKKEKPQCLKTALLKRWRREAFNRIGVFEKKNGKYIIVFDKTGWGDVSQLKEEAFSSKFCQILRDDIETIEEAKSDCDLFRRVFILREAEKEWQDKIYGNSRRKY